MTIRTPPVFPLMEKAAKPVLEAYLSDLQHDRRYLLKIGESNGIWGVRRMGTHIIALSRHPGESAADHMARLMSVRPYLPVIQKDNPETRWFHYTNGPAPSLTRIKTVDLALFAVEHEIAHLQRILNAERVA